MIAVYCPEERQVARLYAALNGMVVQRAEIWSLFTGTVAVSTCAVVMVDWLAGNPAVERLQALRMQYPHKPVVLVTRKDADNVRLLRRVQIEEVVWTEEIEHTLAATIDSTQHAARFTEIVAAIESAEHLPKRLRHALVHVFRSPTAALTVAELGAAVGCDRRTLWRLWTNSVGADSDLRLQDVVDWNLLLHAAVIRQQTTSWVGVAGRLSVHDHTLARTARRLADMTLRQLADIGTVGMLELFRERFLSRLLAASENAA